MAEVSSSSQDFSRPASETPSLEHFATRAMRLLEKLLAPGSDGSSPALDPAGLCQAAGLIFLTWRKAGLGLSGFHGHGALLKLLEAEDDPGGDSVTAAAAPTQQGRSDSGAGRGGADSDDDGSQEPFWSSPLFIQVNGASLGLTAGFESGESLLVLPTLAAVDAFLDEGDEFIHRFGLTASGGRLPTLRRRTDQHSQVTHALVQQYNVVHGAMVSDLSLSYSIMSIDAELNAQAYGELAEVDDILSGKHAAPEITHPLLIAVQDACADARSRKP